MKIASVTMKTVQNAETNFKVIEGYVKAASAEGVDLIVFPEGALMGYPSDMRMADPNELSYLHEASEVCIGDEKGEYVNKVIALAKEYNIYIVTGITERDPVYYDIIYNSMILVGPEGYYGNYRKVCPLDEFTVFDPGREYHVYKTPIGKIGLGVCYDVAFPEAYREMALMGADIVCAGVQWGLSCENPDNITDADLSYRFYDVFGKSRAAENGIYVVISNSIRDTNALCAHSRVIDPVGQVLADTGYAEGMAVAKTDVQKEIISAKRGYEWYTLMMLKDRQPSAYKLLCSGTRYGQVSEEALG